MDNVPLSNPSEKSGNEAPARGENDLRQLSLLGDAPDRVKARRVKVSRRTSSRQASQRPRRTDAAKMGEVAEESFDNYGNNRMKTVVDRVNRNARCRCCLWMVALWCAATVIFMLAGYDRVVHSVAVDQMVLKQGSQKYEAWVDTPVPVYYKVFVFNLTNPEQFMAGGRPRVQERGPYVYLLKESKEEVKFHKNGSVTYRTRPLYFFQRDMSAGSEDDVIISVNIPFVNAADAVKDQGFLRMVIQIAKKIHGFETLRKLTVGELLWGYKSRVIDWARTLQELPYPHQLFGLLVGFNDSMQEPYTMHTGKGDAAKMNQIIAWNGRERLDFWSGERCNEIRGTDANGFAPGVSKQDTLYIFNGQLCRAIPLVYNDTVIQSGIAAFRFVPPDDVFSYGKANPHNNCYCSGGGCPPAGILDMKPCYWGASVGFSFPHFYKADPKLRHIVRGLRPDETKHRTEFDIYPDLGVPLRVKLRMQMNVMLDRSQALERARHFDVVLPIFWFEVGVDSLPGEVVGLLKLAQNLPPVVKTTSVTLCTALTLIFLMLLLAQTVAAWCGWGSSGTSKRPHTPEHLPAHHHYRTSTPPPGPQQRTPSTVSVEIHTTASDDDLPDLPVDPPLMHTVPLDQCPPEYDEATEDLPPPEDMDEPQKVTPSTPPPQPGEPVVAPLARIDETRIDGSSGPSNPPTPPQRPPRSPKSPRRQSPSRSTPSPRPTAPLATSSPHGSNGVSASRSDLPPPLESDL
ncbi:putative scavenger receptor class B member 1 isoform X2 [Penaeus vannamei]|uniref:Scavenger receptor class B member 1 n=1 Tax=Penaeus vannamei TaxID=6689 RepID=A0A3R7QH60_PENVA|nr:putative scavenger receptor class B member 1 isoform X2 [Penaeus vannamei]